MVRTYSSKIDANQPEIIDILRKRGFTVQSIAKEGKGCPDIIVGCSGLNFLFEIKDPANGEPKLKPDQTAWHAFWKGQVTMVSSADEIIKFIDAVFS